MTLSGGRKYFNYDTQEYEGDPSYPKNIASILESQALNKLNITPATINDNDYINRQFYKLDDVNKSKVIDLYSKAIKKRDFLDIKFKDPGHIHYNKKLKTQLKNLLSIKKHSTPKSRETRKLSEPSASSVSSGYNKKSYRDIQQVSKTLSFDDNGDDHGDDFNKDIPLNEAIESIS